MEHRGLLYLPAIPLRTADLRPMGEGRRQDKIHQGEVIRAMKAQAGEKVDAIELETDGFRAQLGFLFERALEVVWREYWQVERAAYVETQLALEHDDVLMTPDGLNREQHALESYKLTWKSARKWDEDIEEYFWPWLVAEKGYLHALNQRPEFGEDPLLTVHFWVGFVNGDYKGPWRLGVWTDQVTFTLQELEDNWANVLRYRDWVLGQKEGGE